MILNALLVSVYWLGFTFVGFELMCRAETKWPKHLFSRDPLTRLFLALALGFAVFIPLMLLGFLLSLPASIIGVGWISLVIYSAVRFLLEPNELKMLWEELRTHKYLWLLLVVLLIDYAVSIKLGGYFSGDAWAHMARINDTVENGFTIFDPYFPQLIDARANVTLIHSTYAAGAGLLGLAAHQMWFLSLAFFRAFTALWVYVVVNLLTKNKLIAALTSTLTLVVLSYNWRFVLYPNQIVRLWMVVIVFGVLKLFQDPKDMAGRILFISGVGLALFSHPIFAAGASAFLALALALHWLFNRPPRFIKKTREMLLAVPVLLMPALLGVLLPARGSVQSTELNDQYLISPLGVHIIDPDRAYDVLFLLFSALIVIYAIRKNRTRAFRVVLVAALLTFPLIAFTPAHEIVNEFLSPRLVLRLKNTTNFAASGLSFITALFIIMYVVFKRVKKVAQHTQVLMIVLTLPLILHYSDNARLFYSTQRDTNKNARSIIEDFEESISDQPLSKDDIVVAEENTAYKFVAVANVSVVKIPKAHAARSSDPDVRQQCLIELMSPDPNTRRPAIRTLQPHYYLLENSNRYLAEASELEPIREESTKQRFSLYRVLYDEADTPVGFSESCSLVKDGQA